MKNIKKSIIITTFLSITCQSSITTDQSAAIAQHKQESAFYNYQNDLLRQDFLEALISIKLANNITQSEITTNIFNEYINKMIPIWRRNNLDDRIMPLTAQLNFQIISTVEKMTQHQ